MEQLELPVRQPARRRGHAIPCDIEERLADLKAALQGRGWLTAKQLRLRGFDERELRDIVEFDATGAVLSFPGSPGYKLFDEATLPEIERAIALKNQARGMLRRWVRYQRRRHAPTREASASEAQRIIRKWR